jgi:hypothetical protein
MSSSPTARSSPAASTGSACTPPRRPLRGNLIAGSGDSGVVLADAAPLIEGNRILDNGGHGVEADDSPGLELLDNRIEGNAEDIQVHP